MSLSSISIRRPVLAMVMSLVIVLFGAICFTFLGVREFPSVDSPVITVTTNYRGASADVIESQITEPLEETVNGIDGIRALTSVSREGRSTVRVEFELGADLERAANDVRDRVSQALRQLPPDVDPPQVAKTDTDAQPIVMLNIKSDQRDLLELTRVADDIFKERLQTIPGTSRIDIWGSKTYAMRLWLDPQKLAAYQLSPLDVRTAIQRENVELPAGRIEGASVELPVRTMSRINTPEEFNQLILKQENGRTVRLRDVGRAELGPLNQRTILKNEGVPMVAVVLRPLPGANYIEIVDEFFDRVSQIEEDLPADLGTSVGFDTTEFIRRSIAEVQQTLFIAFGLVILIIFLFLRDWRTTLLPVLAIPVALVGAFTAMYLLGFSINVLTLLGIILAIGLVVDDAIVVLENIYAKIEAGDEPITAGIRGTREIFFAVIATTLALIAVLLPIFFLGGLTGRLFREFGATLAAAVAISSFVALTLTPMLGSRLLKRRQQQGWFYRQTEPFFRWLQRAYRGSLESFLSFRPQAPVIVVLCLLGSFFFLQQLPTELAPLEDRSSIRMMVNGPEGATFDYMDNFLDQAIAEVGDEAPERKALISVTSPGFAASSSVNSGFMRVALVHPDDRERSQQEIAARLTERLGQLSGARIFVTQSPTISVNRRSSQPVQFVIQAPTMEKLKEVLPSFIDEARASGRFTFVNVDLKFDKPELRVEIDRPRARDLGVSALDIAETLRLTLSEQRLGFFLMEGDQYEVIAQVERENRDETFDLSNLYVRSASGQPILLDKLVTVREESSPPQLYRFDRYVSATVSANPLSGYTVADGIATMEGIADRLLDSTFSTALTGQSRDFAESSNSLLFVFLLALVLVYLVLAAQFESFRDPLIIMFTVPMALVGALFALWYFDLSLNVFSQIGMIMLIGLVTKNGILIVEFANQRRLAGRSIEEAIRDSAAARFRPVLMTSASTILGILPIALALGAGSESRIPMGVAVIGGLLIGTGLTLYIIPVMYTYLASKTQTDPSALGTSGDLSPTGPLVEAPVMQQAILRRGEP